MGVSISTASESKVCTGGYECERVTHKMHPIDSESKALFNLEKIITSMEHRSCTTLYVSLYCLSSAASCSSKDKQSLGSSAGLA